MAKLTVKAAKYHTVTAEMIAALGIASIIEAKTAADQAAKAARERFETAFTDALRKGGIPVPEGQIPVFGFYGISIGVDATGKMLFKPARSKTANAATVATDNPLAGLLVKSAAPSGPTLVKTKAAKVK
jgi:hypothetical protein